MLRKPIAHIEKGGRVYVNDDVRPKPRLTREEIQRQVEEAKKNKPVRPKEIEPYIRKWARIEQIEKIAKKVLESVRQSIENGKTPVILLPDTSMRIGGLFFHTLLTNAFPEYYRKRRLPFVFYLDVIEYKFVHFPEILKRYPNLDVMVVDQFFEGKTKNAIENNKSQLNPSSNINFLKVSEDFFNPVTYPDKILLPKENGVKYYGRGSIAKQLEYRPEYPLKKRLTYRDYLEMSSHFDGGSPETTFWHERDFRKILFKLGIEIGKSFRRR